MTDAGAGRLRPKAGLTTKAYTKVGHPKIAYFRPFVNPQGLHPRTFIAIFCALEIAPQGTANRKTSKIG